MDDIQRVLIVDDERYNLNVLVDILKTDFKTMAAKNGEQALKIIRSDSPPDLVLLDIIMPGMDGYQVCREMKSDPAIMNIPIIFVTAKTDVEDETKGFALGAVDYITKPFDQAVVRARVKTHLRLKRQAELLENLASLDGLTEIPNRRSFNIYLDKEWKRAARTKATVSLLMMDIDFFKLFNDNYGHAAGDDCLRRVAQEIKRTVTRPADFAARYGGEEFSVILPNTELDGAIYLGNKILTNIRGLNIEHLYSKAAKLVTLSIGAAAMIPTMDAQPVTLLQKADAMLYQSKETGRNRVTG